MFTDAQSFLLAYTTGMLCVGTLLMAWFETSFPLMVLGRWYSVFHLTSDLFAYWATNPPLRQAWLGKLLTCQICFGTWMSLIVSAALYCSGAYGQNGWPAGCLALGWPFLILRILPRK